MIRKAKLLLALGSVAVAFVAGWISNGWRLNEKMAQFELAIQESTRAAMIAQANYLQRVNTESAARETDLLEAQDADRAFIQELQDAIESRPIIREVVERPIVVETVGECPVFECPAVPVVDWRVFALGYNCAATGASDACATSGGEPAMRSNVTGN